ncbi:MAG: efflux RND transporter periplasmic adaptor subunit [Candidatus Aminicenantaceae bacterium]
MRLKNRILIVVAVAVLIGGAFFLLRRDRKEAVYAEITPQRGSISLIISASGVVKPRNRLEIKPSISGRVEKVLVTEGEEIEKGEILAWMSSMDRAALLDAARAQGKEESEKWEDVYKPTPIVAPLKGFIIKRNVEPGQTITSYDPILVMADDLIVQAQVDETDMGKLKPGQKARIVLDAYPQKKLQGKIEHIAYESQIVNNVTIYQVDILPEKTLGIFRSGMSANVDVTISERKDVLLLPVSVIKERKGKKFVLLKTESGEPENREVQTGIEDGKSVEIVSGVEESDLILSSEKGSKEVQMRYFGIPVTGRSRQR